MTCGQDGTITYQCTDGENATCNHSITNPGTKTVTTAYATGNHTWGDWVIDQDATTEAAGSKHRTCRVCDYTETAEIPKLETQYEVPAPTLNISDTTCKSAVLKFAKDEKANSYAVMIDGKQAIYDNNASSESDTGYVMVCPRSLNTIMSSDTGTYTFTVFAINKTGEQIGDAATFEYCPNNYHNETVKSEATC